jgi:hypothetical protein
MAVLVTLSGCGGDSPASPDTSGGAAVEPSARWCPEDAGDRGFATEQLLGLALPDAERLAGESDCAVRVVERDGEPLAVTMDFSPTRINVAVEDGLVTEVQSLG